MHARHAWVQAEFHLLRHRKGCLSKQEVWGLEQLHIP